MSDTRESLIKEYADELFSEQKESCSQGGVKFDAAAAREYAIAEATTFVDRCIAVGRA